MKTDQILGELVHKFLLEKKVETPFFTKSETKYNKYQEEPLEEIIKHFKGIMNILGMDLNNDSLKNTPKRVAEMYVNEIFSGLNYENFPKCTTNPNEFQFDEMVTVRNVKSMSVCEHHFVTIDGKAKISYIPKDRILGLSKFNRVVKFFSQRPQVQERLTMQIYWTLVYILGTEDVAVMLEADHMCVKQRGVEDNSNTVTTKLGGVFMESAVRNEFLKS